MNKKDRERQERARREGENAFMSGKTIEDNPYKESQWGVGWFWRTGFQDAKQQETITADRKLKCPVCKREFSSLGEVTAHFYNNCE